MIVPQPRLLFWYAVTVLPLSVLGVVWTEAWLAAGVALLLLVGLTVVDLLLGQGRMAGLQVKLPTVARFSKDREGGFEVLVRNERQQAGRLRLGLGFPLEIRPVAEEQVIALPASHEWSRVEWRCRPAARGCFPLTRAFLETSSPWGFWALRATRTLETELRVYPNLLTERKNLAALFLNRGAFGLHAQRQIGKGREFEKLREYLPGDSFEDIHWKATAKRGRPVTKIFQIERTQEVYVIVDASRLTARAIASRAATESNETATPGSVPGGSAFAGGHSLLDRYVTAALVLGLAAEKQGDLFGLCLFADRVERFIRARNGKTHYGLCRDAIFTLQPRLVTPDYDELATFLRLRLRRRALLIFLTALEDPVLAESFVRNLDLLRHQHLILVNMLKPPGAEPLFSQPELASGDDLYQCLGGHWQWQRLRELGEVLRHRGVRFSLLENEKLAVQLVSQYLSVKQRQLL